MTPSITELTATQKTAVQFAIQFSDDAEAAREAGHSPQNFRGIIDDACLSAGIAADTFAERRKQICELYRASQAQPSMNGQGSASSNGSAGPEDGSSTHNEETFDMPAGINIETIQRKAGKLPPYLVPAAILMGQNKSKEQIAKTLNCEESTVGAYTGKITKLLGLKGLKSPEKAAVIKQLDLKPKTNGAAHEASAPKRANSAKRAPRSESKTTPSENADIERLNAFAEALGGGDVAAAIMRVTARIARYEPIIKAIEAAKLAD